MPKRIVGKEMENNTDYVWDIYEKTPVMPTYTIAIAVLNNYTSSHKNLRNRNIASWMWKGYRESSREFNLNSTLALVPFLEKYFNMTDELPKIDSLNAIDGAYDAMENWGLIIYFRGAMTNYVTIAHELSHFWAGNLVTCKNWDE